MCTIKILFWISENISKEHLVYSNFLLNAELEPEDSDSDFEWEPSEKYEDSENEESDISEVSEDEITDRSG